MQVSLAYIFVTVLWATTPLAIKWSTEAFSFPFAAGARMTLGLFCLWPLLLLGRHSLPWHAKALHAYLAITVQILGSMSLVFWSAPRLPSGWISVIFGLTPLLTGLFAAVWLKQRSMHPLKLVSYLLGIGGLTYLFGSAPHAGQDATSGIAGILLATFLQSLSGVWLEKIRSEIPALVQVTGGLIFSVPVYWLMWFWLDGHWPEQFPYRSTASIAYLGVVATAVGFVFYYYILKKLGSVRVSLVTLIAPVLSLVLGHLVNQEPLTPDILTGSAMILSGLAVHVLSEASLKREGIKKAGKAAST